MAGIEKAVFMNMCMVYDEHGRVLALDKVSKSYEGTTFPGGHVEPGETLTLKGRIVKSSSRLCVAEVEASVDGAVCATATQKYVLAKAEAQA